MLRSKTIALANSSRPALFLLALLCLFCKSPAAVGQSVLSSRSFELRSPSDVGLELTASSPGASWARKGAEAAAIVVEVDGEYNQDLLLWAGDRAFSYRLSLGKLAA